MYSLELGMTSYPLNEHHCHLSLEGESLPEEKFLKFVFFFFLLWFSFNSLKSRYLYNCPNSLGFFVSLSHLVLSQIPEALGPWSLNHFFIECPS